ncbi:MAG: cation:proton antiporter, partial [Candidatus Hydrogenedentes bacterium]|nr:cation:proton antiporter [Candidatus Hydrogenedentota bacterium]
GLVGMLLAGMLLGPNLLGLISSEMLEFGTEMRTVALVIILLRAGLKLNRAVLNRIGLRALLLACIPASLEAAAITLLAPPLLGLDYPAALLLGVALCAVSPAVVVPLMLDLMEQKKGNGSDAPTMVLAAASLENTLVIVIFGILMHLYIDRAAPLFRAFAAIPVSVSTGILVGMLTGALLCFLFKIVNPRATKRAMVLIAASMLFLRLEQLMGGRIPFAALPAVMAMGIIILELRDEYAHEMSSKLAKIWIFAEIVLFTMVGAQVDFYVAMKTGLWGIGILVVGLTARMMGVQLCMMGSRFSYNTRLFITTTAVPKGTVQAAIGATPLLMMTGAGMDTGPGEIILAITVLSILVTAPLGAWAISYTGEHFLEKE